eukprot:8523628-Pyramimonas_sp.AAC.1
MEASTASLRCVTLSRVPSPLGRAIVTSQRFPRASIESACVQPPFLPTSLASPDAVIENLAGVSHILD